MDKIKNFVRKYHVIPYVVIMAVLLIAGYCVKWYRFSEIAAVLGDRAGTLYSYFNIIFLLILLGFSGIYFVIVKKLPVEKIYLTCAIVTGILFMLIVTPFASADEDNHIYKCYDISNLFFGYDLPEDDQYHWLRKCDAEADLDRNISIKNYWYVAENFFAGADSEEMVQIFVDDVTYDTEAVIYYYPAILGITLGRVFNWGSVPTFMLARILMLAMYIFITYMALKKIPVFKSGFALIMLLPSVMARASSISQDGLLMAYAFLFIAYVIHYVHEKKTIKIPDAVIMSLSGVGMAVGKGGAYFPFLLLLFLIPKENFGKKIKYGVVVGASIVLSLGAYALCNLSLFGDLADSTGGATNSLAWTEEEGWTIKYILTNPIRSIKVFINTFFTFGGLRYVELIGSGYGWLQIYTSEIWVAIYTVLLVLAGLNVNGGEYCFNKKQKILSAAVIVLSSLLVILSMWIFWTPLTLNNVVGIQGRYFVPMLVLAFAVFKNKILTTKKDLTQVIFIMAVLVHIGTFFDIWTNMLI